MGQETYGGGISLGGSGDFGQPQYVGKPVEEDDLLDGAIFSDSGTYDEDGNPMEVFSSSGIANQIKSQVGLSEENPETQEMVDRISKYIFHDLKASSPEEAIQIFARIMETEHANSTVPSNVLSVVDTAIRKAQKINGIEAEYKRRQKMDDPYQQSGW